MTNHSSTIVSYSSVSTPSSASAVAASATNGLGTVASNSTSALDTNLTTPTSVTTSTAATSVTTDTTPTANTRSTTADNRSTTASDPHSSVSHAIHGEVGSTFHPSNHPHLPHYTVSVAPMMDCTDRHFRSFARLCSRNTLLYTEMISTGAIVYGNATRHLAFDPHELPVSLQIGGSTPNECAEAIRIAESYGYTEYNLNVGCPSPRVEKGCFGVALMRDPTLVAQIVDAMKQVTSKPVTVKHRLGIGWHPPYQPMSDFVGTVIAAGADRIIIHARTAILDGLSPKQNRNIPPLDYEAVRRIKHDHPSVPIEINGHITQVSEISEHLKTVDGVMIGRAAYANPLLLCAIQSRLFDNAPPPNNNAEASHHIIDGIIAYLTNLPDSVHISPHTIVAHLAGFFYQQRGAAHWRRTLHREVSHKTPLANAVATAYDTICEVQRR